MRESSQRIIKICTRILEYEEGWRGFIYDDATGKQLMQGDTVQGTATIGFGFTRITQENIPRWLYEMFPSYGKLGIALKVKKIIEYDLLAFSELLPYLNEARISVLVCMIYQMGAHGVVEFTKMWEAIIDKNWSKAMAEMLDSKWHRQTPQRAKRMAHIMYMGSFGDIYSFRPDAILTF